MIKRPYNLSVSWDDLPHLTPAAKNEQYKLADPWQFLITVQSVGYTIEIPKGYLTDGPSIPASARRLVPKNEGTWCTSLPHDLLYMLRGSLRHADGLLELDRATVDKLFLIGLLKSDLTPRRCMSAYIAVRWGGWIGWRNTTSQDEANMKLTVTVTTHSL